MDPADDSVDVQSIRSRICDSLVLSAFDQRDYLPLDQLCEILSPAVVNQLLLQHFDEDKVSEYGVEVLGTRREVPPFPARRRRIFAILVLIDQVRRLPKFIENNVDDRQLPLQFDNIEKPKRAKRVTYITQQSDVSILTEFDVWPTHSALDFILWQRIINVPFLMFPVDRICFYNLPQDCTLPFDSYGIQENGGYGNVYQATLHPSHWNCSESSKVTLDPLPHPTHCLFT
jgi:hypothetical protein